MKEGLLNHAQKLQTKPTTNDRHVCTHTHTHAVLVFLQFFEINCRQTKQLKIILKILYIYICEIKWRH